MPIPWAAIATTAGGILGNLFGGRAQGNAIQQASGINQQATNDAMSIIMGLYDEGQKSLSPYANVGPAALNNLQRMTNKGAVPAPASVRPPPSTNAMARFAPQAPAPVNEAVRSAIGPVGSSAPTRIKNAMVGGLVGGLPGAVVGAFVNNNNPSKSAASRGIEEASRQIWGTNTPGIPPEQLTQGIVADVMQRRIPVGEGKAKANAILNDWVAGMRDQGVDEGIIRSSIATQKQYFQPLREVFARLEAQPAV